MEREGFVFVFRPIEEVEVGRLEKNPDMLKKLYNQGYYESKKQMRAFQEWKTRLGYNK